MQQDHSAKFLNCRNKQTNGRTDGRTDRQTEGHAIYIFLNMLTQAMRWTSTV